MKNKRELAKKAFAWLKPGGRFVIGLGFRSKQRFLKLVEQNRKLHPKKAKMFDNSLEKYKQRVDKGYWNEQPKEYFIDAFDLEEALENAGFRTKVIPSCHSWFAVVSGRK